MVGTCSDERDVWSGVWDQIALREEGVRWQKPQQMTVLGRIVEVTTGRTPRWKMAVVPSE